MNIFLAQVQNNLALLSPDESWHCAKVLRMKAGDKVLLIDGMGNFYEAELENIHEKHCAAKLLSGARPQQKRDYYLHLAIAPTKQIDRIEWMLEKCVEMGIDQISFISCRNSERKTVNLDRLQKITLSAVKQSLQAAIPVVNEVINFEKIISSVTEEQKLIAHCESSLKKEINTLTFKNKNTLILIGPEGDFSPDEIALAHANGFEALSLGHNRLRTETAGLYVCQAACLLSKL